MISSQVETFYNERGEGFNIFVGAELVVTHKLVRKSKDTKPDGWSQKYSSGLEYKYWNLQKLNSRKTVKVIGVRTISDGKAYYMEGPKVYDVYKTYKAILVVDSLYNKPFYIIGSCIV